VHLRGLLNLQVGISKCICPFLKTSESRSSQSVLVSGRSTKIPFHAIDMSEWLPAAFPPVAEVIEIAQVCLFLSSFSVSFVVAQSSLVTIAERGMADSVLLSKFFCLTQRT